MNIVIFTWNFLPEDDAEAYCTARFASALAAQGHDVHVVTPKHPQIVGDDICSQILATNIRCTTFNAPVIKSRFLKRTVDATCMKLWFPGMYREAIGVLRSVLQNTQAPVLISRSLPAQSYLIACQCRKYASCWIAHFSDPWPWNSFGSKAKNVVVSTLVKRQVRNVIRQADGISVTCRQVLPFFEREYGSTYNRNSHKFFVVPHIGDPLLEPTGDMPVLSQIKKPVISHCGVMNSQRYCVEVIAALQSLAATGLEFEYLQIGHMDISASRILQARKVSFSEIECKNPSFATLIHRKSKVCLVLDTRTNYSTSLFLPSKFVYLLFTDTPIVVYTPKGSAMETLATEYPEAGIIWAEAEKQDSLNNAVTSILNKGCSVDRTRIRKAFSGKTIVDGFIRNLQRVS